MMFLLLENLQILTTDLIQNLTRIDFFSAQVKVLHSVIKAKNTRQK